MSWFSRRKQAVFKAAGGNAAATLYDIALDHGDTAVTEGGTLALTATARDRTGATLSPVTFAWESSDTAIATVDSSGLVTLAGGAWTGSAYITASVSSVKATMKVTITRDETPAAVSVLPATVTTAAAGTQQFTATVTNAAGRTLVGIGGTWSASGGGANVTITQLGLATAVATGSSNINFTTTTGSISDASPAVYTVS